MTKICLNCSSEMHEEENFWFCPNRACWIHTGFIFHIPKDLEHARRSLLHILKVWEDYEKESKGAYKRTLERQRAIEKGGREANSQ